MWLINTKTLMLEYFVETKIPKYAILSHTWEDEECSFQDFNEEPRKESITTKKGYDKIWQTCKKARKHNFSYAWVDTCCIDKSSSAELTESINSMYAWYQHAETCYVYLSELQNTLEVVDEENLAGCRWFTRGWTLQELIAPSDIRFYNQEWNLIGTKKTLREKLCSITKIPGPVLTKRVGLSDYSIAQRMSWAAQRQTTRTEDLAYCLFGIFDVNMPLIYGEGAKAFRRLQEVIIARGNDMSIFAWDYANVEVEDQKWSLFSPSTSGFANSSELQPFRKTYLNPEYAITNRGLRLHRFSYVYVERLKHKMDSTTKANYLLVLGISQNQEGMVFDHAIPLRKVGPNIFHRHGKVLVEARGTRSKVRAELRLSFLNDFQILLDPQSYGQFQTGVMNNLHFPYHAQVEIEEFAPYAAWDGPNHIFLLESGLTYARRARPNGYELVAAMSCLVRLENVHVQLVLCIWLDQNQVSQVSICQANEDWENYSWIIGHVRSGYRDSWEGFDDDMPATLRATFTQNMIEVKAPKKRFSISVRQVRDVEMPTQQGMLDLVVFEIEEKEAQGVVEDQRQTRFNADPVQDVIEHGTRKLRIR